MSDGTNTITYLYRLETHTITGHLGTGQGPYQQNKWMTDTQKQLVEQLWDLHENPKTPSWKTENWIVAPPKLLNKTKPQTKPQTNHLSGCATVTDLHTWFGDLLQPLLDNGWGIYRYEVKPKSLFIAQNQIAAKVKTKTRTAVPCNTLTQRKEDNEHKSSTTKNSIGNRHIGTNGQPLRLDKMAQPDNTNVRSR